MGEVTHSRALLPALARIPGHVFWRASARVALLAGERLAPGVDLTAYAALRTVDGGDHARSQQEVADAVGVSRTTMVKVAGELLGAGLVSRARNPDDRRSYRLAPTPAGRAAARRWDADVDGLEEALLEGLDADERSELRALLLELAAPVFGPDPAPVVVERVAVLLPRVHGWLHREFQALLEPVGIEPRHVGSLTALDALGPVSQGGLARAIGVSPAGAVAIVDELEERGLATRRPDPADRRTHVIHLAAGAPATLAEARRRGSTGAGRVLGGLAPDRLERLLGLLRRVVTGTGGPGPVSPP